MKSIDGLLNTIKQRHNISSDYKLALFLGMGEGNIANYRHKRSMPNAAACAKIAAALDLDPHVLMVHFEAQRAKDDETRAMWESLSQRLQMGFGNVQFLAVIALLSIAAASGPVWGALYSAAATLGQSVYYVKRRVLGYFSRIPAFVKVCKVAAHVSRNAHPAAFRPA